uniref:Putative secreted protein n=1 Tax=Anopheles darlingi TaxID=43151 RepID=A0A2M4DKK8_ANODA
MIRWRGQQLLLLLLVQLMPIAVQVQERRHFCCCRGDPLCFHVHTMTLSPSQNGVEARGDVVCFAVLQHLVTS